MRMHERTETITVRSGRSVKLMSTNNELGALDYLMIKLVAAQWSQALADGDQERFSECFSPDGHLEIVGGLDVDVFGGVSRGHSDLCGFVDRAVEKHGRNAIRLWDNIPLIYGNRQGATLENYFFVFFPSVDGAFLLGSGVSKSQLEKVGDTWRFQSRSLAFDDFDQSQADQILPLFLECGVCSPVPTEWAGNVAVNSQADPLDYELILQTHAGYNHFWDFTRQKEWVDLFTEDGEFNLLGVEPYYETAPTTYKGKDALLEYAKAPASGLSEGRARHWNSLPFISIQGDRAIAYVPCMASTAGALSDFLPVWSVLYADRMRKVDGKWLFEQRVAVSDYTPDHRSKVVDALSGRFAKT